jgi:hypothetical protein
MIHFRSIVAVLAASVLIYSVWVQVPAQQDQEQPQHQQQQQQAFLQASSQTDLSQSSWLHQQQCQVLYNSRREMTGEEASAVAERLGSPKQQFCPALLWTYTGTGNTMTRMLIEVASGWYTGSVYTGTLTMLAATEAAAAAAAIISAPCHMGMLYAN